MHEDCRLFGTEKLRTTPYKPSTNQVERFHRTMNSILAKTVSDHHQDWDSHLSFALAAFRATRHDSTGYTPKFLVLGRKVRTPPDIVYRNPEDEPDENYDSFVEKMRDASVAAFAEVRANLQRSAERNKKYYDIGIKPKQFDIGQCVLYFNPRKFQGKQNKWIRQYEGPFLVIVTPSSVRAKIQRSAKVKSKIVHIDKLKAYLGKPPKKWTLPNSAVDSDGEVETLGSLNEDNSLEADSSHAKVSQTQHLLDSVFSDDEGELFEDTPDNNFAELPTSADAMDLAPNNIAVDSAPSSVVGSENSTSCGEVVDNAQRVDGPRSKQSSTFGEQG